ncbi:MAG TPA: hypothetical protein VHS28_04100 [Chloroflexota bacterium]|nr:hypothetical protein [Chloroflexota bacterium]
MSQKTAAGSRNRIALVLAEIAVAAALVVAGGWTDRASRSTGPESPVNAYASSLAREDLQGALHALAPGERQRSTSFVEWQLGNRYHILESSVRSPSILDRITGGGQNTTTVAVTMEIQEAGNAPWRASEELKVGQIDGRWYLLRPPLEP